jgi:hypothetical protein
MITAGLTWQWPGSVVPVTDIQCVEMILTASLVVDDFETGLKQLPVLGCGLPVTSLPLHPCNNN